MPLKESAYPADWLQIAERDLRVVTILLAGAEPGSAGFHLQQAVEKFLKAYLLSNGWTLVRTHDLDQLLLAATQYDSSLNRFSEVCQNITEFYLPYSNKILEADVLLALADVQGLIDAIRAALTPPAID